MTGPGEEEELKIVLLHRHPEHIEDCLKILNGQWPRSKTLRLRSLHSSCDQMPTSLALLRRSSKMEAIGHARINLLPQEENGAWVESVVVREDLRGRGYGRALMAKTEDYVRSLGFRELYLSTHDQQVFYGKLGYEFCDPVCIYGGVVNRSLLTRQFAERLVSKSDENTSVCRDQDVTDLCRELSKNCTTTDEKGPDLGRRSSDPDKTCDVSKTNLLPPPPPPPPPSKIKKNDIKKLDLKTMSKMYMKKDLV